MAIEDIKQNDLELELVNNAVENDVIKVLKNSQNKNNQTQKNTRRLYMY